ncbi:hypothetical protein [Photobacterium lutimaris]|uniref:Uncharacterized protein n=1 Tax=Photobacterium lutimaris TaxID=388278 RepID=A0A2T3ITQ5_9GAMM|nr:hypothetical protein [Photobacterium lutimaris]PSU31740.1 hypothetical protein C9I99_21380 [Photobacterium lutimaris]TDR72618.1 hypothetical protein DFP78_11394 [Photobacterium lutimaris]
MHLIKKAIALLLLTVTNAPHAGVQTIRDGHINRSIHMPTNTVSSEITAHGLNSQSLSSSLAELDTSVAETTQSIANNISDIENNKNQVTNASNNTVSIQATYDNHKNRIHALENRPPPIPDDRIIMTVGTYNDMHANRRYWGYGHPITDPNASISSNIISGLYISKIQRLNNTTFHFSNGTAIVGASFSVHCLETGKSFTTKLQHVGSTRILTTNDANFCIPTVRGAKRTIIIRRL